MLGLSFTSKLDKGSYIIYINKTASKKFLIWPCMEHSCHVWAGAPNCSLHMLDKLQKWACRTVGPSLAASLEPLTHHGNAVNFSLSIDISLIDVHLNWLDWSHFLIFMAGLLMMSNTMLDFSFIIHRCYKGVYVNNFLTNTTKLWNSLPAERFSLTYDLTGFKFRINRHLLSLGSL